MRELNHSDVREIIGGVATGWVPANWQLLAEHQGFVPVGGPGAVRIPGLIPGPIFRPGQILSSPGLINPTAIGDVGGPSQWEC